MLTRKHFELVAQVVAELSDNSGQAKAAAHKVMHLVSEGNFDPDRFVTRCKQLTAKKVAGVVLRKTAATARQLVTEAGVE